MNNIARTILRWFVSDASQGVNETSNRIDWLRVIPFILIHLACFLVIWVGFSWIAFFTALILYWIRGVSISAFYHRYFSHRAFETSRISQFIFGVFGASATQKGPLWWASFHRNHHQYSDKEEDAHSPVVHGFFWSHVGWFLSKKHYYHNPKNITDLARFPELVLLDRYNVFVPIGLMILLFIFGSTLHHLAPSLGTTGSQMLIWGFFISTTALFHTTAAVNSLTHQFGKRKYQTTDNSRNNFWLALFTFGEGWHNNHHHYPASAKLGFHLLEIDITYYVLKLLEKMGIIWKLRYPPQELIEHTSAKQ